MSLRKGELAWLVRKLGISIDDLVKPSSFEIRLKIQKAVFLLKHLGVKPFTRYNFNLYLRGPYSPDLALDYYNLEGIEPVPVALKEEKLLKWFSSHSMEWLEVASSIISIKERYPNIDNEEVYSLLLLSKPWINRDLFERIMGELREKRLPR